MRASVVLPSYQPLELSIFLKAILMGVMWYPIMFLIFISLMDKYIEYLFMCLFAIYISFPVKCCFVSFAHVLIAFFVLLLF